MTEQQTQAMRQALEALVDSIDLVEENYANAVNLYGKYPSRAKRLIGMETMRDDHRKAITALTAALEQSDHIGDANKMVEQPTVKQSLTVEQSTEIIDPDSRTISVYEQPAKQQDEQRELVQVIAERDYAELVIDALCDAVLGKDRPEWSSAYGYEDAIGEVEERIDVLVLLAQPQPAQQEPFGYFRPEPFGWTDCAETDEGAVALYERPQAREPQWIDPNDKTQKQYLPHIGEPVLFCHNGKTYTGNHTGGSFQSEVTNQYFNTWECRWMYMPAAHGITGEK